MNLVVFQPSARRWRRLRRVTAVAMLAALVPAAAASAAATTITPDPQTGFGYNVQSLVRPTGAGVAMFTPDRWPGFLGLMAADGLRTARADSLWRPVEPSAPVDGVHRYDWSNDDRLAAAFAGQGLSWDVVLAGSPAWAGLGPANQFSSPQPDRYADFAAYTGAFAARYGASGSFWAEHPELPRLPIVRYEVWNEPNTETHWGTTPDPAAYASLYAQASAAIRSADPAARVSVGGIVWNDDVAYIDGFFAALPSGAKVDGLGSHPYAPTVFSLAANVVRVRQALDATGHGDVPLDINELGWPAAYDRPPSRFGVQGPVSDASRAATMALTVDALSHSTCGVADLMVYDLVESEQDPTHVESLMGLYRSDGRRTATSAAFSAAVSRFRADRSDPGLPVPVCGARGAGATRVLPLALSATPGAPGCVLAGVTYRGLPLEEAQLRVSGPHSAVLPTDSNGQAAVCGTPGTTHRPLRLEADVPGVAASNVASCVGSACRRIGPAAACATAGAAVVGSHRIAIVLRRGLHVAAAACRPQLGRAVHLRVTLTLTRPAARRAGIAARGRSVTVGRGAARLAPGRRVVLHARFSAAARRALRRQRRVGLTVQITASGDGGADHLLRHVTLRR